MRLPLAFPVLATCAVLMTTSSRALADDHADADRLYQEALANMDAGNLKEACPKLERSQSLDPALGTQFELASCYELAGRWVEAVELYGRVNDVAHQAGKKKLEESARVKQAALLPKVPRLVLRGEVPDGAEMTLDGKPWSPRSPLVDVGPHTFRLTGKGLVPFERSVTTVAGKSAEIDLTGVLKATDTPKGPPATALPNATEPPPSAPPPATTSKTSAVGVAGLVTAGVGVVGLGVGLTFGGLAMSKNSASNEPGACDASNRCTAEGRALREDAISLSTVSTVFTVIGGALVAGGLVTYFVAPRSKVTVGFAPQPGGMAFALGGAY